MVDEHNQQTPRSTVLMVGTRKGLWIGHRDPLDWTWSGPHFDMQEVYSCMVETRGPSLRLFAGASSSWHEAACPTTFAPTGTRWR